VKRQRTDARGAFAFQGVARGVHRVVARVPEKPEVYFTTPSRVEVQTGERIAFGVATTPARLIGTVKSDSGVGVGGVRVLLMRGAQQILATTDSDGQFIVAAPPGEWQLSIIADSVPPGYLLAGLNVARSVMLDRAQPQHVEQVLHVLRRKPVLLSKK
jgi:hypothetical protein